MVSDDEFREMVANATRYERDLVHEQTQRVLAVIKAAGSVTLMPAEHVPTSGIVVMVAPKIYEKVRQITKLEARVPGQ